MSLCPYTFILFRFYISAYIFVYVCKYTNIYLNTQTFIEIFIALYQNITTYSSKKTIIFLYKQTEIYKYRAIPHQNSLKTPILHNKLRIIT